MIRPKLVEYATYQNRGTFGTIPSMSGRSTPDFDHHRHESVLRSTYVVVLLGEVLARRLNVGSAA